MYPLHSSYFQLAIDPAEQRSARRSTLRNFHLQRSRRRRAPLGGPRRKCREEHGGRQVLGRRFISASTNMDRTSGAPSVSVVAVTVTSRVLDVADGWKVSAGQRQWGQCGFYHCAESSLAPCSDAIAARRAIRHRAVDGRSSRGPRQSQDPRGGRAYALAHLERPGQDWKRSLDCVRKVMHVYCGERGDYAGRPASRKAVACVAQCRRISPKPKEQATSCRSAGGKFLGRSYQQN